MKTGKPERISFAVIMQFALLAAVVTSLVVYSWVIISRLQYPYELEWIEGGMAEAVHRLVMGERLYAAPGIDYVPFLYPPLYFYISSLAARLVGGFFLPLRLVSILSSLVSFAVIFKLVRMETGNVWLAFLATGLFAASYRVTGAWLDIGRVDSLYLAFTLLMIFLLIRGRKSSVATIFAGVFAAAAFLTKQTALVVLVPIYLILFWQRWKHGLAFLVVWTAIVGLATLLMDKATSGWFSFYVFGLLSQQTQWLPLEFISFWKNDLLVHLPFTLVFTLYYLFTRVKKDRTSFWMWFSILAGVLAGSFLSRVKIGGYDNVLLPLFAVLSITFALGVSEVLQFIGQPNPAIKKDISTWIQIACLMQFVILSYNPFLQVPTQADREAGDALVEMISDFDGKVYLPDHGYLLTLAGRDTVAHHSAIWDILRTDQINPARVNLQLELEQAISQKTFEMIILDPGGNFCCKDIAAYYVLSGELFPDDTTFIPVTGDKRRPLFIYLPAP